ncbi:dUTP pyrophosphatase [Nematocida sp. LUAm3]|nr:dUTP pyrophosphatase [Nematocida sp. LUAm3]KAI5175905.1 dUTP pyrophosphatase [Nematocida sp. LUAm2]KAI5178713.1 dUTP pyrophosphatase [Nematocida sp. LUAm1]
MTIQQEYTLKVQLLYKTSNSPKQATEASAGYDLYSVEEGVIQPGERKKISVGICIEIPKGHYGQVGSRSGLCLKHGVITLGGIIDSDYRGELFVLLLNTGSLPFTYGVNDRIAQLVILPVFQGPVETVTSLTETVRAAGGFGSTGK